MNDFIPELASHDFLMGCDCQSRLTAISTLQRLKTRSPSSYVYANHNNQKMARATTMGMDAGTMPPDQVALCALEHYKKSIVKGKPKDTEWTVYAAIVVEREEEEEPSSSTLSSHENKHGNLWVVSSATGTKCTALRKNGWVLHDGHAEVLARRGLVRVLWMELLALQLDTHNSTSTTANKQSGEDGVETATSAVDPQQQKSLLESDGNNDDGTLRYRLRSNLRLHLYISDSPCGDASIYPIHNTNEHGGEDVLLYTGAKIVCTQSTGVDASVCGGDHQLLDGAVPVAREDTQLLGRLRTKSGRSNLAAHQRCTSMSCSDKIVRWSVLGLQGSLLSKYISKPIRLSSVVVSEDPRLLLVPPKTPSPEKNTKSRMDPPDGPVDCHHQHHKNHQQRRALQRATTDRAKAVWASIKLQTEKDSASSLIESNTTLPAAHIVSHQFASGKAAMAAKSNSNSKTKDDKAHDVITATTNNTKKRKRDESSATVSPCGIAFNWQQSSSSSSSQVEFVVGARGIRQGKKPKCDQDYQKLASRLSRSALVEFYKQIRKMGTRANEQNEKARDNSTYQGFKERLCDSKRSRLKASMLESGPLVGWLADSVRNDFELDLPPSSTT